MHTDGEDDAENPEIDKEVELETLKYNYDFLQKFLKEMKEKQGKEGTEEVRRMARNINMEIEKYVSDLKGNLHNKEENVKGTNADRIEREPTGQGSCTSESEGEQGPREVKPKVRERSRESRSRGPIPIIDNRLIAELEKFEEEAGMNLQDYLHMFERYHEENYKGGSYLWIRQLEKHLTGRALEGFKSVRRAGDEYETVKKKLIEWYAGEQEDRSKEAKERFKSAVVGDGENLLKYTNRLLSLFEVAYPNKVADYSSTILKQFRETISNEARLMLDTQIIAFQMDDRKMLWKDIQKWARLYDKQHKKEDKEVITISLSKNVQSGKKYEEFDNSRRERQDYRGSDHYRKTNSQYNPPGRVNNNQSFKFTRAPNMSLAQRCKFCKRFGHAVETCRKRLGTCYTCGKKGHQSRNCFSKGYRQNRRHNRSLSPGNRRKETDGRGRSLSCQTEEKKNDENLNC